MRNRNANIILRGISVLFLSATIVLTIFSLINYSRSRNNYPLGMTIAGVPVGGLTPAQGSQRLLEVYTSPIELLYGNATIQVEPAVIGFQPDVDGMLAAADLSRTGGSFWSGFWDHLWNREPAPVAIPLRATLSEERLRDYLQNEIASRYDLPPTPAQPVPGSTTFLPGLPGQTLDIDRAVIIISDALKSPDQRSVLLTFTRDSAARPTIDNLEILLKQIIQVSDFDGLIGLFMVDLQNGQEIHFSMDNTVGVETEPDIAFTASSTMKIPVIVSFFINRGDTLDEDTRRDINLVLGQSDNNATDRILDRIDLNFGPLIVTRDMEAIGLKSTFLSAYFSPERPIIAPTRNTPGNQRADVNTHPDPYSQTTTSEMGTLLMDIYLCSQTGGGALLAAFPDKINQSTCQSILDFMALDRLGALIQGGVPDGTLVPHKHGYVPDPSDLIIHDISDTGLVYTPGGNFVLSIFTYHPIQNIWDITNPLFADLTRAVYNYFNIATQ